MGQGKDKQQRTRRTATAGEHNKKADKRAKQAEKQRVAEQQAGVAARRSFLSRAGAGSGSSSAAARGAEGVTADSEGGGNADEDLESGVGNGGQAAGAAVDADAAAAEEDPEEDHEEAGGEARREARPADVEAELDDEDGEPEAVEGVMATYLKAVFDRLHSETTGEASRDAFESKWLLAILKEEGSEWWLRASRARSICAKLGLEYDEPAYYHDILVWLPDERWGAEAMPPCVECKSAEQVGVHGFQTVHFGRRVCSLKSHYFMQAVLAKRARPGRSRKVQGARPALCM